MRRLFAAISVALFAPGQATLADPPNLKPLEIGAPAPEFQLPGVDGKTHALGDYRDAKVLVVVFTCNHCPTAQAYEDRLIQLHRDYKDRGVALVAISPNDPLAVRLDELGYTDLSDSFEDMKLRAKMKQFPFPYLYDGETQKTSIAYGALATPHVFIFDSERKLRYQGRIDDAEVKPPTSHDAKNAIEALLAGKPVPVATTRVFGCSTKWSDKRASAKESLAKWDMEEAKLESIDLEGVKKLAANEGDRYRLFTIWATWCGPCVQELPELVTMHRMYRGRPFEIVSISIDEPSDRAAAQAKLNEVHASFRNYHYGSEAKDALAEAIDKDWPGPIPHTFLVAPGGKVVYRKTGEFDALELKRAIADAVGRTYAAREK
jgi:peroxiredoxin